jgi:hypothetical protein
MTLALSAIVGFNSYESTSSAMLKKKVCKPVNKAGVGKGGSSVD